MYFLGVDIGSSSSKAALVDGDGKPLAAQVINLGAGSQAADDAIAAVLEQAGVHRSQVNYTVATGYGRMIFRDAEEQVTEITCHAREAATLLPGVRTVIDIGGQDAKVIRLNSSGGVVNFLMNEKCAAGTGRFLEVMARILGCGIQELSGYAERSTESVTISSTCTVFAESEVISQLASGKRREDVARGAHLSVAKRVAGLAGRVGVEDTVAMTGGVALNRDLVNALELELGHKIQPLPNAQALGAIGAALIARDRFRKWSGSG